MRHILTLRARGRAGGLLTLVVLLLVPVSVGVGGTGGLALGTGAPAAATTRVTPQVAIGVGHSCALRSDGTVWCWGSNGFGQLGDGTTTDRLHPVQVVLAPGGAPLTGVTRISARFEHTCALLDDGTMRCWGAGSLGRLGDGGTADSAVPVTVVVAAGGAPLSNITRIAAGGQHTCAVLGDGTVRCWGLNSSGELGIGTTGTSATPVLSPTAVVGLDGAGTLGGVSDVTAGQVHTCALLADEKARCWGFGGSGRLGDGTTTTSDRPVRVLASGTEAASPVELGGITALSAGGAHTCALTKPDAGTVRCWGSNGFGQTGDGGTTNLLNPYIGVSATASGGISSVAAGTEHTCALYADDLVRCWGRGGAGQLGDGGTTNRSVPTLVGASSGTVQLAAGAVHTCAIMSDDTVRCWGSGGDGRLGDGETVQRTTPVTVLASGTAATDGPAFSVRAAVVAAPVPSGPAVSCSPDVLTVGTAITCTVTGGDPGIDILWRAAVNPVIAEAGVTLDADGRGEFTFTVPASAAGRVVTVELVDWTAPVAIGGGAVVGGPGGPVPSSVPAGEGGAVPGGLYALLGVVAFVVGAAGTVLLGRRTPAER